MGLYADELRYGMTRRFCDVGVQQYGVFHDGMTWIYVVYLHQLFLFISYVQRRKYLISCSGNDLTIIVIEDLLGLDRSQVIHTLA